MTNIEMTDIKECPRCKGSGQAAYSTRTGLFVAYGPVPDDARYAIGDCPDCRGTGYVERNGDDE